MHGRWAQITPAASRVSDEAPPVLVRGDASRFAGMPARFGRARAFVGLKLFHTDGDSERAVRQIDGEINGLLDAAYAAMGVDRSDLTWGQPSGDPSDVDAMKEWQAMPAEAKYAHAARVEAAKTVAKNSPHWHFFQASVVPLFSDWTKFRQDEKFFSLFTSWEEYEKYLERVRQLRGAMAARGIKLLTPAPLDLSQTLPGEIYDAGKEAARKTFDLVRIVLYAALAVSGVGALIILARYAQGKSIRPS